MPLVSVLMSVHNGENTLCNAVKSIQNQTIQDIEIVICDDASSDGTYRLLQSLQLQDSRIRILRNEFNKGLAKSLNESLNASTGLYLARMDDDDFSFPNRFAKEIEFLEANPEYAFVASNVVTYDGKSETGMLKKPEIPNDKEFLLGSPYLHPTVMFRREALISVGGYSEKKMVAKRAQDYELFARMASVGLRGYNLQEPYLRYYFTDSLAQKKRSLRSVINNVQIRYYAYKQLKFKRWKYVYMLTPIYIYIKYGLRNLIK